MPRYALNSEVLTAPGRYDFRLLTVADARSWWIRGPVAVRIGNAEVCGALACALDIPCPAADRRIIRMEPGDEALVYRFVQPSPDARCPAGSTRGRGRVVRLLRDSEFWLLSRLS